MPPNDIPFVPTSTAPVVKRGWNKGILYINFVSLIAYLLLVFGLDFAIVSSDPSLMEFWILMLGVFAIYMVFFLLETFLFRKKFAALPPGSDTGITVVIILRNLLFLLNFIPYIQLLGLIVMPVLGPILLILYVIFITKCYMKLKPQVPLQA